MVGLAAGTANAADAQQAQAAPAQTAQAPNVEEIVVTGSRIVRNGYEAPTPVSVLSAEDLQADATTNIADQVNRMPAFSNSTTPHNSSSNISTATSGINNLNLRGLGPNRTLVLVDGQRVVASTLQGFNNNGGAVDINIVPSGLVQRVDVVTGGASAAYGSDALAGVVNFVLDHNFTGIKGEVEGGVTTYGDDRTYKIDVTAGAPFANDRGHFLLFAEDDYSAGIGPGTGSRPWTSPGEQMILNPAYTATNGQPQYLIATNVGLATSTPGGLITTTGLKGTAFGPGGVPYQLQYGSIISGNQMVGGAWQTTRIDTDLDLDIQLLTQTAFTRFSYDVSDNINVFAQVEWGGSHADINSVPNFRLNNLTIRSDNAFLPQAIAAQATALGVTQFGFGTTNLDVGDISADTRRYFHRYVVGAEGKVDAFDTNWKWDTYYQESSEHISAKSPQALDTPNYLLAIDAVRSPTTGAIVCRSTLTNPTNGCVPFDVFGIGVNSQAAKNYVSGTDQDIIALTEDAAAAHISGEPFSDWAGPVSLASGIEWRHEYVGGIVPSPVDAINGWFAGNYHATLGHYDVTEGYVETVIPLAKDTPWAKSLDLNGAVRATGYSTSGYVTTWKAGATWAPIDDIRFRATRSRDIRAPSLGDLFNSGQAGTGTVNDDFHGNAPVTIVSVKIGNADLQPEVADTTGVGVVVQPSFIPGFSASFDYYDINIAGAIESLSTQQYVDFCFAGQAAACSAITRNAAGSITAIQIEPVNIQTQIEHGFDVEASYKLNLSDISSGWNGDINFRGLGTYVFTLHTVQNGVVTEGAGVNADGLGTAVSGALYAPRFRYTVSATYENDPLTATLTARGISAGVYNNSFITCTSGCPTATAANPTINYNHISAIAYFDLSLAYKFMQGDHGSMAEAFLTVENLMNQAPPFVAGTSGNGYYSGPANQSFYDRLGRYFHAGVRFKM